MAHEGNEGIVVRGSGSISATNVVAGQGAHIYHNEGSGGSGIKDVSDKVDRLLQILQEHQSQIPEHAEVAESAQSLKAELEKPTPNRITVKSLLGGIMDAVKSVSAAAIAAEGLKTAVVALLGL